MTPPEILLSLPSWKLHHLPGPQVLRGQSLSLDAPKALYRITYISNCANVAFVKAELHRRHLRRSHSHGLRYDALDSRHLDTLMYHRLAGKRFPVIHPILQAPRPLSLTGFFTRMDSWVQPCSCPINSGRSERPKSKVLASLPRLARA